MLITRLQILTLKFQQRQWDKIEAASQSVVPILNSNFQNRWPKSVMTFGPDTWKDFRQGKRAVIYKKVFFVCLSVFLVRPERTGHCCECFLPHPPHQRGLLSSYSHQAQREGSVVGSFPTDQMYTTLQRQLASSHFVSFPREVSGKGTWTPTARVCRDWTTRKPGDWWGAD